MFFDDEPMGGQPTDGGMTDDGSMPADDTTEEKTDGDGNGQM